MQALLDAVRASDLASEATLMGELVTCTLVLTELSASLGVLDLDEAARGLFLEGRLPAGEGRLALSPERGLGGAVAALSEIELDVPAIDDAWVIRGDAPALLVALQEALLPLASAAPRVDVEDQLLRVRFTRPVPLDELPARVQQALALWERVASFRAAAA